MQIKATRRVEKNIVSTTLTIDAFGSEDYTPEEEREVLNDYKLVLNSDTITFMRYVQFDEHANPHVVNIQDIDDPSTCDRVMLALSGETYEITEDMAIKYAVDIDNIGARLETYGNIYDNMCLAKAMICVFEDVIISWIGQQLEISKMHKDTFEETYYYVV